MRCSWLIKIVECFERRCSWLKKLLSVLSIEACWPLCDTFSLSAYPSFTYGKIHGVLFIQTQIPYKPLIFFFLTTPNQALSFTYHNPKSPTYFLPSNSHQITHHMSLNFLSTLHNPFLNNSKSYLHKSPTSIWHLFPLEPWPFLKRF